ncbi:ERCC4 domain-containing protein [Halocatena marina]|uniref:ERCC4 domain-containing protein n=1 Tax=Halocatena marina TaxID=2934937 RepID=A0ABD5YVL9_9EURY|nr:ERCC4 domain-containing protein [Halocatena marina]
MINGQVVVIDDREKRPWDFPGCNTTQDRLNVGDYTYEGFEEVFAVERKSLNDLATSCGTGRSRFEDEIRRAQDLAHFAVIIEADRAEAQAGNYYCNIHPNALIGTIDKWPKKFPTLDFIWAGDRERAAQEAMYYLDRWYLNHAAIL